MISVLGYELQRAKQLLEESGYAVCCTEIRSRKGVEGNEARVVRQLEKEGCVELVYAIFKTDCEFGG